MDTRKELQGNGAITVSRPAFPLAAASKRFRVITRDEIQKRIDQALELDRKARTQLLHDEAKARIIEARSALQEAIREIERIKAHEAELSDRVAKIQAENEELRAELHRLEHAPRITEPEPASSVAPPSINGSALAEKAAWDSLAARITRVEELLAAHLLQDHRGPGRSEGEDEDPPETNGRTRRRRLR